MGSSEFKLEGELSENLQSLLRFFPKEAERFMKKEAREFRNYTKKKARSAVGKITGNYLKGFSAGRQVYEWSDSEYNIRVFNKAPHNHLIELGHKLIGHKPNKTKIGRVKAYEIMNNAMNEWENDFEKAVQNDLIDFITKELEK